MPTGEKSMCIVIMGRNESPEEVLTTLRMCRRLQMEYIQSSVVSFSGSGARIVLCHMSITENPESQAMVAAEWEECVRFCTASLAGIVPVPTRHRYSEHLPFAMNFIIPVVSEEFVLLVSGNGAKSELASHSGKHLIVYQDWLPLDRGAIIVPKDRDWALFRKESMRGCNWSRAMSGRTVRRVGFLRGLLLGISGRFTGVFAPEGGRPLEEPDLGAIHYQMDTGGKKEAFISVGGSLYRLERKAPDQYSFPDMLWMVELSARLEKWDVTVLPV